MAGYVSELTDTIESAHAKVACLSALLEGKFESPVLDNGLYRIFQHVLDDFDHMHDVLVELRQLSATLD